MLPRGSILASHFSEKVGICFGNKAIQRPQFRMKNFATNCARRTMWIFYAAIQGTTLRASWTKRSRNKSAQSIQPFIVGESIDRQSGQFILPAHNSVQSLHRGYPYSIPAGATNLFLLRKIKQLRDIQRHVPKMAFRFCESGASRHPPAQKKTGFPQRSSSAIQGNILRK